MRTMSTMEGKAQNFALRTLWVRLALRLRRVSLPRNTERVCMVFDSYIYGVGSFVDSLLLMVKFFNCCWAV